MVADVTQCEHINIKWYTLGFNNIQIQMSKTHPKVITLTQETKIL